MPKRELMKEPRIRKKGQLRFFKTKLFREIPVLWELEQGELNRDKTWVVSISFTESFGLPSDVSRLVFDAMLDPSISLKFKTENFESDCVIYDISEFADTNVIDIGSPNLPMIRMTLNKPNKK